MSVNICVHKWNLHIYNVHKYEIISGFFEGHNLIVAINYLELFIVLELFKQEKFKYLIFLFEGNNVTRYIEQIRQFFFVNHSFPQL